ncbi:hypothetical protein Tco_0117750 [Tanacetum coccineum]
MFEDLEYVQSLEKEVDELESEKAEFSNEYDLLLQECVSKDIMCSILRSFESLDDKTDLQCSNDMVCNYYLEEAKKKAQLQEDKALNSKPSVITPGRLRNTASGSKPKPRNYNQQTRNWLPSISSSVTNKDVHIAEKPRNQKLSLKSKDLACPTYKKCIYTVNHDACIFKYLSKVNSRASA